MDKIIKIGDQEVGFKATASTPKRYAEKFQRDLLKDVQALIPKVSENELGAEELNCFMNMAYIMAKQYDKEVPEDPNDWLDNFEMFDIYMVLPQIVELWGLNNFQMEEPKKKVEEQSE